MNPGVHEKLCETGIIVSQIQLLSLIHLGVIERLLCAGHCGHRKGQDTEAPALRKPTF